MGSHGKSAVRRRWIGAGLAAGSLLGAILGAGLLTGAVSDPTIGPRPTVLHAAPALVRAGVPVDLTLSSFCREPEAPSCHVTKAVAEVTPAGAPGATTIEGRRVEGVVRFRIPAELVPPDGFTYRFVVDTGDGQGLTYPPGATSAPIRVLTTEGLPGTTLASFRWTDRAKPVETVIRLAMGSGPAQVGVDGIGDEGGASGPSSFDVTPGGTILVADWVHQRVLRFSETGTILSSTPLPPGGPVDIAVNGSGLVATTLGTDAEAFELSASGRVLGRYPVGYGVTSRIVGGVLPRVRVGSAQWIPVRAAPGAPLTAEVQAQAQTATVPLVDGSIGLSDVVGDRLAIVWTRPDGSRAGALLRLPEGVQPGADYFVRPLPDGGALAVQGLWDETHFAIAAVVFDAAGTVRRFTLLPEPTTRMAAPFSTVRFEPGGAVLLARDAGDGMRLDRFGVM